MKYKAGLIGWAATAVVVAGYEAWALKTRHPTLSATFGAGLRHPALGPLLAGAVGALSWHLLVEEVLPKAER